MTTGGSGAQRLPSRGAFCYHRTMRQRLTFATMLITVTAASAAWAVVALVYTVL